jgi:hypothetical protein
MASKVVTHDSILPRLMVHRNPDLDSYVRLPAEMPAILNDAKLPELNIPDDGILVALGDLEIDGLMAMADRTQVVVCGNLKAGSLIVMGDLVVYGSLEVGHLYANSFNNCVVRIGGDLSAVSVIEKGHDIQASGRLIAKIKLDFMNVIHGKAGESVQHTFDEGKALLSQDVTQDDGGVEERKLMRAFHAGKSPIREV